MTPAEKERAAVVAWLRKEGGDDLKASHGAASSMSEGMMLLRGGTCLALAGAIERGDHLTGRP